MELTEHGAKEVLISSAMPSGTVVERDNEDVKTEAIFDQSNNHLNKVDSDQNIGENNTCKPSSEDESSVLEENAENKQAIKGKKKKASSLEVWKDILMGKSTFERKKKLKTIHHSSITSLNEAALNPLLTSPVGPNAMKVFGSNGPPSDFSQNKLQSNSKQSLPAKPFTPNSRQYSHESINQLPMWDSNLEDLKRKTRTLFSKAFRVGFDSPVGAEYKKTLLEYKKASRNFKRLQNKPRHWLYLMFY